MSSNGQRILAMKIILIQMLLMFIVLLSSASSETSDQYLPIGTGESYSYNDIPFEIGGVGLDVIHSDSEYVPVDTIDLSGYTANKIHIIEHAYNAVDIPNGTLVGKVQVFYKDGSSDSIDLIMGVNIAEWAYDRIENQCCLAHTKISPAYSWWTNQGSKDYYWGHRFYFSINTQNKPLDYLKLFLDPDPTSYFGIRVCPESCGDVPGNWVGGVDWFGIAIQAITLQVTSCCDTVGAKLNTINFSAPNYFNVWFTHIVAGPIEAKSGERLLIW